MTDKNWDFVNQFHVTVIEKSMKGWIMDGIAKEAPMSLSLLNRIVYLPTRWYHNLSVTRIIDQFRLRHAGSILFLHHRPFFRLVESLEEKTLRVFITHVEDELFANSRNIQLLRKANRLIFQNASVRDLALRAGIDKSKTIVGHGAVSHLTYFPAKELHHSIFVLICGEFKPRKNPEDLREVIDNNRNLNFVIHGDGWKPFFSDRIRPNLTILPFRLSKNPELMRNASVLLTLSTNEGGPFPILEALASGTPVVSTETGFAQEVVTNSNGVVLKGKPTLDEIRHALLHCLELKRQKYTNSLLEEDHSWTSFARNLYLA